MKYKFYSLDNKFIEESDFIPDNFTGIIEYRDETKFWHLNGKKHRIDGPAVEGVNGFKTWYFEDKLHNLNGAAIEWSDGTKFYHINGKQVTKEQHTLYVDLIKLKGLL